MIPSDEFLAVVRTAPLISVDLILQSREGKVLLGRRNNRPAQGYWFVPGGRIMKGERLRDALARIVHRELGPGVPVEGWTFCGVYEHFYDDNFAGAAEVGTHYIVLPHQCVLEGVVRVAPDDQHDALRWFDVDELMNRDDVHPYTKAYFDGAGLTEG